MTKELQQESELGTQPIGKLLMKYSIPCVISLLINALYNVVDQIFIGRGVGYLGNGATNVVFPLTITAAALAMMIGDGGAAWLSLKSGEGNKKMADRGVGNAIMLSVIVAVVFFVICLLFLKPLLYVFGCTEVIYPYAFDYGKVIILGLPFMIFCTVMSSIIRADGSPKYAMIIMLSGCVLNVILDAIYIFPLQLGVVGAAWATITGQFVSAVISILYFKRFRIVTLDKEALKLKAGVCGNICLLGISSFINQATVVAVSAVANNLMKKYGADSIYGAEIPLTAMGITMKVNSILLALIIGVASGAQPIVGYNYGARKFGRVKKTYKTAMLTAVVIAVICTLIFQFKPMLLISLFGAEEGLYNEFAQKCFRIFLLLCICSSLHTVTCIFLQSIGRSIKSAVLSLARQIIFFIPLAIIMSAVMGLEGVLWAGPVADAMAFVLAMILVVYELKKMKGAEA